MKNITFNQAYKLFNKEASTKIPKHVTKDWYFIMKINCIEGIAGLNKYFITDSYEVHKKLILLEKENNLTLKKLFNHSN